MKRILIVDDEQPICEALSALLRDEGFVVDYETDSRFVLSHCQAFRPDLVILDYRMPIQSGVEVIRLLRSHDEFRSLSIVMVIGVNTEEDKVAALELGADDYIIKPYSPKELAARVRAVLRRASSPEAASIESLQVGGLILDMKVHRVKLDGEEIHLTLTEFKILAALMKSSGEVLSRDKLRQKALGNLNVTDRTIDVHMASLRKKLGPYGEGIQTVRGVGYRFLNPM